MSFQQFPEIVRVHRNAHLTNAFKIDFLKREQNVETESDSP